MSRRPSAKKATVSDAFTAGVTDDEPSSVTPLAHPPGGAIGVEDEPIVQSSAPPAGHDDATPPSPNPGIVMSDDEAIPEQFLKPRSSPDGERPVAVPRAVVQPAAGVRYEHRIRVLEAFHYPGNMNTAPAWVDRNWLAYGDYDERRKLPAGPALNVPTPRSPTGFTLCRNGDYIVQQEVIVANGVEPLVQVEVWEQNDFERLFIPIAPTMIAVTERHRVDEEAAP